MILHVPQFLTSLCYIYVYIIVFILFFLQQTPPQEARVA